jgi:hypothetical protein
MPPTPFIVQVSFLNGMIAFAMATLDRKDNTARPRRTQQQYILEGKRMMRFVKKYALWNPTNFVDKQFLLEAEFAAFTGQPDQAMHKFTCAIAMSKVSRNLFVQGLANERAGRFCYSRLEQPHDALLYFDEALVLYQEWKAYRKVNQLRAELKMLLDCKLEF